jgi:hypothetical protein
VALTSITKDFVVSSGLLVQGTSIVTTSSSAAGTLSVQGGAAIAQNISVGSTATIWGPSILQNTLYVGGAATLSSTLYVDGATGIRGALNSTGTFSVNTNLFTVDGSTGNAYSAGTLGVQGAFNSTGSFSVNSTQFTVDASSGNMFSTGTGYFGSSVGIQGALNSTGTLSVSNSSGVQNFTVDNTGNLTAQGTGYFNGAVGIQGALNSTGTLSVSNSSGVQNFTVDNTGNLTAQGTGYFNGAVGIQGALNSTGTITTLDTTSATTGGAGALVVKGGEYIEKNLIVNGSDTNTATLTSNALYVKGGVGINNGLQVQGTAVFQNDVYFNGQTTYVFSTNTVYTDNLIELHSTSTGVNGAWTFDDQKDIGFRFHYFQNSIGDLNAALVLAADSHEFEFYRNGTETNGSFVSHDYAGLKAATLTLVGGTTATNTTTGDLVVSGGVGIGGKLYVSGGIDGTITTSTNIDGGGAGYIPIQSANGKTAFIPAGAEDGSLLTWNNANSTATWVSASSSIPNFARYAGTATNIGGGNAHDIPFQSATSTTSFDTGLFQYDSTLKTLKVDDVTIYGKGDVQATYTTNNAIVAATGTHIGVWSDTAVNLNYKNTNIVQVDNNGATLGVGTGGQYTLVLGTAGDLTLGGATGGGTFIAPFVNPANLTSGYVTFYDGTTLVDDSGLTYSSANQELTANQLYVTTTASSDTIIVRNSLQSTSTTASNALYVQGGIGVEGQSYFGKSIRVGDNVIATNQVSGIAGVFFGDVNGFGALYAGTTNYVELPSTVLQTTAFVNDYAQNNFQNTSTGVKASTDWVATAGDGTDTENYIDMGIVTANWDGTQSNSLGTALGGNDGYLYVQGGTGIGGNLVVGASSTGTTVKIVAGGADASYTAAIFRAPNIDATSTSTGTLSIAGGVGIGKSLYVGTTATIGGDLYVDGTLYVQGSNLTGIDKITGSTGTFVDIVSTGTAYLGTVTATNTLYVGSTATFRSDVYVDGTLYVQGNSLTGVDKITGSTGTFVDIVSTGTAYLHTISGSGHIEVTNTDDADRSGYAVSTASISTLGGIKAAKSITAGGVVAAGDFGGTGSYDSAISGLSGSTGDSGSVEGFYVLNNMQAARTVKVDTQTGAVVLDSWDKTLYTSAKYLVQIVTSGGIHVEEIMIVQDATDIYMSQYGLVYTNISLGIFDAEYSSNNLELRFTPAVSLTGTIQVVRQSILTAAESYS